MDSPNSSYISVSDVIELIKAHTDDKPTVDLRFLAVNRGYIEKGRNFTVKLLDKKDNRTVEAGVVWARVNNDAEKYTLLEEIKQAYKNNYDLDLNLDERPTREITTVVDPKTNPKGVAMRDDSKDPMYTPTKETLI